MKLLPLVLMFILFSCAHGIYFTTPNDVFKMKGTVVLNSGQTLTGYITIRFEENFNAYLYSHSCIEVMREGADKTDTVKLNDIKGYYVEKDTSFYALKNVFLFVDQKEHLLFVKRLTGEQSKIGLYVLHQTGKSNSTGEETDDYFISLPGSTQYETINTHSVKMIPDFDIKMSAFVDDCPSLANKIRLREPGYFLPFVTIDRFKHRDVFLKIISDYNSCQ